MQADGIVGTRPRSASSGNSVRRPAAMDQSRPRRPADAAAGRGVTRSARGQGGRLCQAHGSSKIRCPNRSEVATPADPTPVRSLATCEPAKVYAYVCEFSLVKPWSSYPKGARVAVPNSFRACDGCRVERLEPRAAPAVLRTGRWTSLPATLRLPSPGSVTQAKDGCMHVHVPWALSRGDLATMFSKG